jgi:hypothetical protein
MTNNGIYGTDFESELGVIALEPLDEVRSQASAADGTPVVLSSAGWLLHEAGKICKAMLGLPFRSGPLSKATRPCRSPRLVFLDALLTLGQRMYAAGIDDGELGAKISALDECIEKKDGFQPDLLLAERNRLLVRLALAALEDDGPLPDADNEYEAAKQAQAALQMHKAYLKL